MTLKHFHTCLLLSVGVYPLRGSGAGLFQFDSSVCCVRPMLSMEICAAQEYTLRDTLNP